MINNVINKIYPKKAVTLTNKSLYGLYQARTAKYKTYKPKHIEN